MAASSLARKAANAATSSGLPKRPAGIIFQFLFIQVARHIGSDETGRDGIHSHLGGATSCANAFVAPITAALAAE